MAKAANAAMVKDFILMIFDEKGLILIGGKGDWFVALRCTSPKGVRDGEGELK